MKLGATSTVKQVVLACALIERQNQSKLHVPTPKRVAKAYDVIQRAIPVWGNLPENVQRNASRFVTVI